MKTIHGFLSLPPEVFMNESSKLDICCVFYTLYVELYAKVT